MLKYINLIAQLVRAHYNPEELMIVSKDTNEANDRSLFSQSALRRKDMRRGRQVLVYRVDQGVTMRGTIMSSPFDENPKQPDRDTGRLVLIRSSKDSETRAYRLDELGVVPDENGDWNDKRFLLDANRYDKLPQFGGSADANDPCDRE